MRCSARWPLLVHTLPTATRALDSGRPILCLVRSKFHSMTTKSLLAATLFLLISVSANAKDYDIPEIGAVVSLSDLWIPVKADIVTTHNDDMLRRRPQTRLRFIAGFTRGTPPDGFYSSTDYLWIQRTPPPASPATPEQIVSMIPKVAPKITAEVERAYKDTIASMGSGPAHYDERIGAVVWDCTDTLSDGNLVPMRCYLIVTKGCWISINAYATPASASTVFSEVRDIVSTLKVKEDQRMPESWLDQLKHLLSQ